MAVPMRQPYHTVLWVDAIQQGRTGERASEMESYGVSVSAREMQGRGSRLSISLALTRTPSHSYVPQSATAPVVTQTLLCSRVAGSSTTLTECAECRPRAPPWGATWGAPWGASWGTPWATGAWAPPAPCTTCPCPSRRLRRTAPRCTLTTPCWGMGALPLAVPRIRRRTPCSAPAPPCRPLLGGSRHTD